MARLIALIDSSDRSRTGRVCSSIASAPLAGESRVGSHSAPARYVVKTTAPILSGSAPAIPPNDSTSWSLWACSRSRIESDFAYGVHESLLVEHGELVGVAGRSRADESDDKRRLAREAQAREDDRPALVRDDARMDEDPVR